MTPEEARELLEAFIKPVTTQELEEAYVHTVRMYLSIAPACFTRQLPDEERMRLEARALKLCEHHTAAIVARHAGQPDHVVETQLEMLEEEIEAEARHHLRERGLPESWRQNQ